MPVLPPRRREQFGGLADQVVATKRSEVDEYPAAIEPKLPSNGIAIACDRRGEALPVDAARNHFDRPAGPAFWKACFSCPIREDYDTVRCPVEPSLGRLRQPVEQSARGPVSGVDILLGQ